MKLSTLQTPHLWGTRIYFDTKPGVNVCSLFGVPTYFEGVIFHGRFSDLDEVYSVTPKRIAWRSLSRVESENVYLTQAYDFPKVGAKVRDSLRQIQETVDLARRALVEKPELWTTVSTSTLKECVLWDDDVLYCFKEGLLRPSHYGMLPKMVCDYIDSLPDEGFVRCLARDDWFACVDNGDVIFIGLYRSLRDGALVV